jgi:hypothetical protein
MRMRRPAVQRDMYCRVQAINLSTLPHLILLANMFNILAFSVFLASAVIVPAVRSPDTSCANAPSSGPLKTINHFSDGTWAENL